jgi:hypothetical protein
MLFKFAAILAAVAAITQANAAPAPPLPAGTDLEARSQSYPCNSALTLLTAGDWTQVRATDNRYAGFGGFGEASQWAFPFDGVNYKEEHFNVTVYEHTADTWWEAFQAPLQTKSSWNVSSTDSQKYARGS